MLKLHRTYKDYNGNTRTKDFYFNLTETEIVELDASEAGGIRETIDRIVAAQNGKEIIALVKKLILLAYGEKSPDGERFIKNQELRDAFSQTEAFNDLFMELATDADAAANFINGIIPAKRNLQNAAAQPQLIDQNVSAGS